MKCNKIGIINVRKEKGYTSHDVVAIIRKIFRDRVGHTGTLDPNATGVLPICIGRATKLADYFAAQDKAYTAEIIFGLRTDTLDIAGKVQDLEGAVPAPPQGSEALLIPKLREIVAVAEGFKGEILQVPPMYSAVKVGGKKLYELARKGQVIERKPRRVVIHDLRVRREGEKFFLDVNCSKGTYIRSLCADIGESLGCGAVMGDLVRTQSGKFFLRDAVTIDEIKAAAEKNETDELIIPPDKLLHYPAAFVREEGLSMARNGNPLPVELVREEPSPSLAPFREGEKFWLYASDADGGLIGLFRAESGVFRAEVML